MNFLNTLYNVIAIYFTENSNKLFICTKQQFPLQFPGCIKPECEISITLGKIITDTILIEFINETWESVDILNFFSKTLFSRSSEMKWTFDKRTFAFLIAKMVCGKIGLFFFDTPCVSYLLNALIKYWYDTEKKTYYNSLENHTGKNGVS